MDDKRQIINKWTDVISVSEEIIQRTRRELIFYIGELDIQWLADQRVVDGVRQMAVRPEPVSIRIMVGKAIPGQARMHPLVSLAQRLSSHIQLRTLTGPVSHLPDMKSAYLVSDNKGILFRPEYDQPKGWYCMDCAGLATGYSEQVDTYWKLGKESPEIRRLMV